MRTLIVLLLVTTQGFLVFSQSRVRGVVTDTKGNPIFAANVYPKSSMEYGVITNMDGSFEVRVGGITDTLVVSFIGYKSVLYPVAGGSSKSSTLIKIVLPEESIPLGEAVVRANDPISEKFSVVRMERMDIYLNPVSQGDPLKAITLLPASTTTDETASPSLRGSSADRSRVMLNGVPIYSPVKASMLNNQGFFSLFNPEIIDKQYVYASNPPLTHGNTSAGLVEIQTIRKVERSRLQVSTSLASTGILLSQELEKKKSFIQLYGNYQFSDAFVAIQRQSLPQIKNFETKDAGLSFNRKFGNGVEFSSFSYIIDEVFSGNASVMAFSHEVNSSNRRYFTVNNIRYTNTYGVFSLNNGFNTSKQHFGFGNIKSANGVRQFYSAMEYKLVAIPKTNIQAGVSHDYQHNQFKGQSPLYFFALAAEAPSVGMDTSIFISRLEGYIYASWDISKRLTLSMGGRIRLPAGHEKMYVSSQVGMKYNVNHNQWVLLSGGVYHSHTTPSYYHTSFSLLKSNQLALDYTLQLSKTKFCAALYAKLDEGEQQINTLYSTDGVKTLGAEVFLEHELGKRLKVTLSNTFIQQTLEIGGKEYKGENNLAYLLKASVQYMNPKLFNVTVNLISRPGKLYTPVVGSSFHMPTGYYIPTFHTTYQGEQYNHYTRLDLSLSRYFPLRGNALLVFASVNNVLNRNNQKAAVYSPDYSQVGFDLYTLRTLYFGAVWQLNGKRAL